MSSEVEEHPVFSRVKAMPEPWRSHFPKSREEAQTWRPKIFISALHATVLVVAQTRIEGKWKAYCGSVPGYAHKQEAEEVLRHGNPLREIVARAIFPILDNVPYSD